MSGAAARRPSLVHTHWMLDSAVRAVMAQLRMWCVVGGTDASAALPRWRKRTSASMGSVHRPWCTPVADAPVAWSGENG